MSFASPVRSSSPARSSTRRHESRSRRFASSRASDPAKRTMIWIRNESFLATDGQLPDSPDSRVTSRIWFASRPTAIRPRSRVTSRATRGTVTIDFELKKGKERRREGGDSRNLPAAGAKVALGVAGSQINVKNGDIDDGSNILCARRRPTTPAASISRRRTKTFSSSSRILRALLTSNRRPNGSRRESSTWNPGPGWKGRFGSARRRPRMYRSRSTSPACDSYGR